MSIKYIGMDVHQATIVIVVLDQAGKRVMETIIETRAWTIVQFLRGLEGSLYVTFEEGNYADWLYDLLTPYVEKLVVCDPTKPMPVSWPNGCAGENCLRFITAAGVCGP